MTILWKIPLKCEIVLENATENPLENATDNPRWFLRCRFLVCNVIIVTIDITICITASIIIICIKTIYIYICTSAPPPTEPTIEVAWEMDSGTVRGTVPKARLELQIAVALPNPQIRVFPDTEFSRKIGSPNTGRRTRKGGWYGWNHQAQISQFELF